MKPSDVYGNFVICSDPKATSNQDNLLYLEAISGFTWDDSVTSIAINIVVERRHGTNEQLHKMTQSA